MSVELQNIVKAINRQTCVLFVGPDVLRTNGSELQSAFFNSLKDEEQKDAKFDELDKFWSFRNAIARRKIIKLLAQYYKNNETSQKELIKKLAAIPFHLIVSLVPDERIHKGFDNLNIKNNFDYFKHEKIECEKPNKQKPLIYNLFGNIVNREYVLSYDDFQLFTEDIVKIGLPGNLKDALIQANYYLFIGFEFDHWANILLLYILNNIKSSADKLAFESIPNKKSFVKIIDDELNLSLIDCGYSEFIEQLYHEAKKSGIIRKTQTQLEKFKEQLNDLEEILSDLEEAILFEQDPRQKLKMKKQIKEYKEEYKLILNQIKENK